MSASFCANTAGLSSESKPSVTVSGAALKPWMTGELVQQTRRVWSPRYGRELSDEEAVEILDNTKRLAEALLRIHQEKQSV